MFISSRQNRTTCTILTRNSISWFSNYSCLSGKLLDVTVNNSLSWSDQIGTAIKKCNTYLYILSRIKLYLSTDNAFIMLIFSLILIFVVLFRETAHITSETLPELFLIVTFIPYHVWWCWIKLDDIPRTCCISESYSNV